MNKAFVLDASMGFAWVYPGQATAETDKLLEEVAAGSSIVVPPLWFLEVANSLLAAQRRKLLTPLERKTALKMLSELTYIVDEASTASAFHKTSDLAEKHGLSVYDAAYLELALRRRLPLASRDAALRRAAKQHGIKVQG